MSKNKKQEQLGMNPSTASGRLVKDLLFDFIQKEGIKCFRCEKKMTRETFSIEHKIPWLDSENPIELYFNLDNISFSHLPCNSKAARRNKGITHPSLESYNRGCRCNDCRKLNTLQKRKMRLKHNNKF